MPNEGLKVGAVWHIELVSKDRKATQAFYKDVFGWSFEHMEAMDYTMWTPKEGRGAGEATGGLRQPNMEGEPTGTLTFIGVDSIEATIQKAEQAGGKVLVPKQEIPGNGWFAVLQAPGELAQGIFQAPAQA